MKKILILIGLFISVSLCNAQSTVGLVAHWSFDSTTNDVSGNGHNGHGSNITLAAGKDGVMGHGYYFNGTNSMVTVPYSPAFNVTGYSIYARVKVMGYYTGTCHANIILVRGNTGLGNCVYMLQMNDVPSGSDCTSPVDTNSEVFWTGSSAPSGTLSPASLSACDYTPRIVSNQWYDVVATFNDTVYKVYIDGVLKSTAYITTPGVAMGTGTDSISIGYDLKEAPAGYPFPFKGVIDDIMLYNRALSATEVLSFNDTCGSIALQPRDTTAHIGNSVTFSTSYSTTGASFQWQQDGGTGYVNLSNAGPYSGVTTSTLHITGVTSAMSSYHYRCIVSGSTVCTDTTRIANLSIATSVAELNFSEQIVLSPNPVSDVLNITLPGNYGLNNNTIRILNLLGETVFEAPFIGNSGNVDVNKLIPGSYIVKLDIQGNVFYKRIIKK